MSSLASISASKWMLALDIFSLDNLMARLDISNTRMILASVKAKSALFDQIQSRQFQDNKLYSICDQVLKGESRRDTLVSEGIMRCDCLICVLRVTDLIQLILWETHYSRYYIYPKTNKMYRDLEFVIGFSFKDLL